jgi:hypothetical protein
MGCVIELFMHGSVDERLFARIEAMLGARFIRDVLYVELYVPSRSLPLPWLRTLTFRLSDPHTGTTVDAPIDVVTAQEEEHLLVRSKSVAVALVTLSLATTIELVSPGGRCLEGCLRKLLDARAVT